MDAFVIAGTLIASFATAFFIQKAALEGLFRIMDPQRLLRVSDSDRRPRR